MSSLLQKNCNFVTIRNTLACSKSLLCLSIENEKQLMSYEKELDIVFHLYMSWQGK